MFYMLNYSAIIAQDTWEDYEVHEHYEAIDTEGANDITTLIINAMKIQLLKLCMWLSIKTTYDKNTHYTDRVLI